MNPFWGAYFSNGLKPPTRGWMVGEKGGCRFSDQPKWWSIEASTRFDGFERFEVDFARVYSRTVVQFPCRGAKLRAYENPLKTHWFPWKKGQPFFTFIWLQGWPHVAGSVCWPVTTAISRLISPEVRINGLFHLLINGIYWGCNQLILTFDPNFLGHPFPGAKFHKVGLSGHDGMASLGPGRALPVSRCR